MRIGENEDFDTDSYRRQFNNRTSEKARKTRGSGGTQTYLVSLFKEDGTAQRLNPLNEIFAGITDSSDPSKDASELLAELIGF